MLVITNVSGHGTPLVIPDLVEKPDPSDAPSDLGIVGAYALTPDIFEAIEKTPPGKNGEVQLTDALPVLLKRRPIYAFEFDGRHLDIGRCADRTLFIVLEEVAGAPAVRRVVTARLASRAEKQLLVRRGKGVI